jgi:2-polyprenyl-3-methyl-5-hydroxy-6-metoxy-1,4-benzoquinol methylase
VSNRQPRNPHFDDNRVLWKDEYSGQYAPVAYEEQFDAQWRMFLNRDRGFRDHTGVETDDEYIDDRIAELTGVRDFLLKRQYGDRAEQVAIETGRKARAERRGVGGRLYLEPKFPTNYFQGKSCIDIGCGAGRWTKTLLSLGARVKSMDVGEAALESTRRLNTDVEQLGLFDIGSARPDLVNRFDFALCWGVIMCTHDPKQAFEKVASTVKPGGSVYIMVYAPTYHSGDFVTTARRTYHREKTTPEERIAYLHELSRGDEDNMINYLDMLNTFYNWVIDEETIVGWCRANGLNPPVFLNRNEPDKCGHHVLIQRP